jgi:hypothetical protein
LPIDRLPVSAVRDDAGRPVIIEVPLANETLLAQVWEVAVGRTRLFLLDTDD